MHIANRARQGRFMSPMHFVFRFMVSATFLNQSAIEDSIESNLSTICFFVINYVICRWLMHCLFMFNKTAAITTTM